ncbi:hypothetical protein E4U42_003360 [Claviceps africana]|uniref:Uncharacterized protein n=1 Tax=Claviceps africana TaxID=83212 RepID=A0A8K0NIX0_9HYPO|nr:hypothetical protein E4U42_003360 [Claviceps africana]
MPFNNISKNEPLGNHLGLFKIVSLGLFCIRHVLRNKLRNCYFVNVQIWVGRNDSLGGKVHSLTRKVYGATVATLFDLATEFVCPLGTLYPAKDIEMRMPQVFQTELVVPAPLEEWDLDWTFYLGCMLSKMARFMNAAAADGEIRA